MGRVAADRMQRNGKKMEILRPGSQCLYGMAMEAELDELDETYAEPVQLAYTAQTAFANAKGKSKGKGKPGGKSGSKVFP